MTIGFYTKNYFKMKLSLLFIYVLVSCISLNIGSLNIESQYPRGYQENSVRGRSRPAGEVGPHEVGPLFMI